MAATSPQLQFDGHAAARDQYGNALGGIRTPAVDAPTTWLRAEFNAAAGGYFL